MNRIYRKVLNSVEVKKKCHAIISNRFAALRSLEANVDLARTSKILDGVLQLLTKEIVSNYVLHQCEPLVDKDCSELLD